MAKVNDEGKEYIADVSSGLRLTADIPNGELGYVLMAQLVTRYGITELKGITESGLNTQTRVGVYKYSIMKSGASKADYGLLFVYSSDVPTSGSGDYPLYQTRFQDGKMQTRSRTMPNGLWSDWREVGGVGKPGTGENSEVFNDMENNQAAGDCAHAEGGDTKAQGDRSHAEGTTTTAAGYASHSEGSWTVANNESEHAEGAYNKSNTGGADSGKTLHSVGIGTADNSRKNAHEIMRNGDHYVYGIGGYDGTNPGAAKTLQEVVNEAGGGGGITDLGTVAEADLDGKTDPGVYLFATAPAVPPDTQEALVVSQSTGGASRVVTQVRFGQNIRTRSWKNSTGTWSAWTEIGGGSSVEVVQTTGQSTTSVMSQKAVTDELAKKATKTELNQLNEGIMKDEGLYEDVDTLGETFSRTSTNGEQVSYINHRIEEYAVGADAPDIFTYDEQVHTLKLAQFTVHPQEGDLSFIEQNSRGVLIDPTWSYVNFICSNEPRYFSARIGGGKCVLVDTNGETSGDHYIQLFAEAAYSASTGNIEVSIFAEYKLSGQGAENNPLYINGNLPGYLRIWIV